MSVYNRKMFKRNARNALNQSAGIPSVARFQTGGSVLPPRQRVFGAIPTIPGVAGQRMRSYSAPDFSQSMMPRANMAEVARRYIAGEPITASEFSALRGAEQGFLSRKGLSDSMGAFGKSRLGSGIKALLGPAAEIGGQIRGFTEGATSTAAKTLLGSPDGSLPADTIRPPELSSDYLKSLGIETMDLTNLQSQSARGGFPSPSSVRPRLTPTTRQYSEGPEFFNDPAVKQRLEDERLAREAMAKDGIVVTNEEAELKASGILPGNPENIEAAAENRERALQAAVDAADRDEATVDQAVMKDGTKTPPDGTDASGDPSETGTTGTVPSTKEEIDKVINQGNEADQKSALDGFIKEFMDKAPGYEGTDSGLILAKIGFAMAAGKSPRAIENIASALSDGADMLIKDKAKKDEFNRQLKLSALQYGLTETSKISSEERALARANADVVEMVVGKGGTSYNGRDYGAGESIFISKGDLKEGSFPPNILGTSAVTALKNQNAATATALKNARDLKKISPAQYDKQISKYNKAVTSAINAESGISLLEGAMVTVTDGKVTGLKGAFKDAVRGGGAFLGMDLTKKYGDKKEVQDAMRAALQDVIPVTLGSTQSANSISNRDVDFLIQAYFGEGALNGGVLSFATQTESEMVRRLQRAADKMRKSQKEAFATMRTTEQFLAPLLQPGTDRSAAALLTEDQRRLQEAGLRAGGAEGAGVYVGGQKVVSTIGATRGDDGIIRFQTG
tara:strand:+ start:2028 stop:4238 length:2211 start_codon:yes stop_codon:yes gene_type:complete